MADEFTSFEQRLSRIGRTHKRPARRAPRAPATGPVVGPDGLIVVRPRRRGPSIPIRGLLYLFLGFCLFKSVAIAHFGLATYDERIGDMKQGTVIEQAGAWALQPDRLSVWIAARVDPFIK